MAIYFDRKSLQTVLAKADSLRRQERKSRPAAPAVLLVRAARSTPPPGPLKALVAEAVAVFGGTVDRDLPDGLVAVFEKPAAALKAALHALHALDLAGEMLFLPPCRMAVAVGPVSEGKGKGMLRAAKILPRAAEGEVAIEPSALKEPLTGYHDIVAGAPRKGRVPGLGVVTTVTVRPEGLDAESDAALEDLEDELRTSRRK